MSGAAGAAGTPIVETVSIIDKLSPENAFGFALAMLLFLAYLLWENRRLKADLKEERTNRDANNEKVTSVMKVISDTLLEIKIRLSLKGED